jgi:hypothetical protein
MRHLFIQEMVYMDLLDSSRDVCEMVGQTFANLVQASFGPRKCVLLAKRQLERLRRDVLEFP